MWLSGWIIAVEWVGRLQWVWHMYGCSPHSVCVFQSSSEDTSQRSFPAIVVTIKEMQFLLNLSNKVASTGRFQTFCVRFTEQFSPRQRIWTLDPKKGKLTNFGTITRGTFRLCIATKKRFSDKDPSG